MNSSKRFWIIKVMWGTFPYMSWTVFLLKPDPHDPLTFPVGQTWSKIVNVSELWDMPQKMLIFWKDSPTTDTALPETNGLPLKIGRAPKGNDRIPTIHFQVQAVSFREGIWAKKTSYICQVCWSRCPLPNPPQLTQLTWKKQQFVLYIYIVCPYL